MPKIKTHKATAKRFKVTGKRKLRRMKQRRSHLRRKKSNTTAPTVKARLILLPRLSRSVYTTAATLPTEVL